MKKGFAPILILVFIAVIAVGGYFLVKQNVIQIGTPVPTAKPIIYVSPSPSSTPAPLHLTSWNITADASVQFLVTDPSGRQTGFQSAGDTLLNIPDSSYGMQESVRDDPNAPPAPPPVPLFGQNGIEFGTYKVQVFGFKTGQYTITFDTAGIPGIRTQSISGTTHSGQIDTYLVTISTSGFSVIQR